MAKKILITGSNGFLGRHLIRQLEGQGNELFFIKRAPSIKDNEVFWDFNNALPSLPKVDVMVHLAADINFGQDFNARQYQVNTLATAKLAEGASKQGACLIFASSVAVHGTKGQLGLSSPIVPTSHYGITKWLAEEWIRHLAQRWIILRINGLYGLDGPAHLGLNHSLSQAYHQKIVPTLNGAGKGRRNYINIQDAAQWVSVLCRQPEVSERQILYMASSQILSIKEYLQQISRVLTDGQPLNENAGHDGEDMLIEPSPSPVALTPLEDYLIRLHHQRMPNG